MKVKRIIAAALSAAELIICMSGAVFAESFKNEDYYKSEFNKIAENDVQTIKSLLEECEARGISADYEISNLRVIELFIPFGINDASENKVTAQERDLWMSKYVGYGDESKGNDKTHRAEYILEEVQKLSKETIDNLNAYLEGSKVPKPTSKYVTSEIGTDGVSFVAADESGQRRPMFFTGYGHFSQAMTDIPIFKDMGVNIIESEIGISRVMAEDKNGNFILNPESDYLDMFVQMLDNAAENDIAVNVLLSPHYLPTWFKNKYPEAVAQNYFTNNDDMKRLIKAYIDAVIPKIKDKAAVHSICLTNEPGCQFTNPEYDLPRYRDYLKELFGGDISSLNAAYNTEYSSFEDISFPEYTLLYEPEKNVDKLAEIYNFLNFNDKSFAEFHEWMYALIKEYMPDVLVGTKIMQTFDCDDREWRRRFLWRGTDPEMMGEVMTLNGNDANNYLNDPQDYQWDIHSKMSFYDLQASVSDAPVFDFENHVIRDRDDNYGGEEMVRHVASDIWQGTLHGRGGSTLWVWERTYDDTHDFSGSILNRPDVVAETSKTMLDIGRLTEELTAIEKSAKRIGILYSKAARVYSNYYANSLTTAYEAAVYSGEKVDFVTPKQINNGKLELSDIDILIVPESSNVEDGTIDGIYEFVKNGGKVIIVGRNSLSANQYNKPLSGDMRDYIFSVGTVFETSRSGAGQLASPSAEDIWNAVLKLKKENGIGNGLEIRDAETGEEVYGIASQSVFENGRLLVNICNYVYDSMPEVRLSLNGKDISMVKELRSGQILTDKLTLTPYEPILLEYKPATFDDIYGHWAEWAVSRLAGTGIVSGVGEGRFEPDRYITAEEFIAMTENAAGVALTAEKSGAEISRAAAAEILSETCAKRHLTGAANAVQFCDENDIPNSMAVAAVTENGLMFGYPDGSFRPNEKLTRAEAAAVIQRLAYILD